jgi:hypothetical protein
MTMARGVIRAYYLAVCDYTKRLVRLSIDLARGRVRTRMSDAKEESFAFRRNFAKV